MTPQDRDRVLALAGLFQAACLVQQLASKGSTDPKALFTSLNSVLVTKADDVDTVYSGIQGLSIGLNLVNDKCSGNSGPVDMELARYVISLIQLQIKLTKQNAMVEAISQGIDSINSQLDFFKSDDEFSLHPTIISKLAELYKQTISTLMPRIKVTGDQAHLTNPVVAEKIRAILLAGIRAAFLWRQLGGRRWHLLFRRKLIADQATRLLQGMN